MLAVRASCKSRVTQWHNVTAEASSSHFNIKCGLVENTLVPLVVQGQGCLDQL